jgi:hypothetical protein
MRKLMTGTVLILALGVMVLTGCDSKRDEELAAARAEFKKRQEQDKIQEREDEAKRAKLAEVAAAAMVKKKAEDEQKKLQQIAKLEELVQPWVKKDTKGACMRLKFTCTSADCSKVNFETESDGIGGKLWTDLSCSKYLPAFEAMREAAIKERDRKEDLEDKKRVARENAEEEAKKRKELQEKLAKAVDVTRILRAYEANEVAADKKYDDQQLTVTGYVSSIDKGGFGGIFVWLAGGTVGCNFGSGDEDEVAKLRRGQRVVFSCKPKGLSLGHLMMNCSFE